MNLFQAIKMIPGKNEILLSLVIGVIILYTFAFSDHVAYAQVTDQPNTGNANTTLKISNKFFKSIFSTHLNSSSIEVLQKYFTQQSDIVTSYTESPRNFYVPYTLFPYFPNQTKAVIVPNISDISDTIRYVAPSVLTKGKDIIAYDPEVWDVTPPTEYDYTIPGGQSAAQSMDQAADMVHSAGYLFGASAALRGPSGSGSPSLIGHYQEINWTKIDFLFIQTQQVVNSESYLETVKQISQFVKTQSPNTKIIMSLGFSKNANFSQADIISALNFLNDFDGVQILYLPINGCTVCTDQNLDSLLYALSISPTPSNGTSSNSTSSNPSNSTTSNATQNQPEYYKIPPWIKHNAQWWADDEIGDQDFLKGIEYLINQGIMVIPASQPTSGTPQGIPIWIKNNAKWWANNEIGDEDFVKGMQFLVANNIIHVSRPA